MSFLHVSVLPEEVSAFLNCRPGKIYVDCTLGGGGHSASIMSAISPDGILVGIDRDADAVENARKRFSDREGFRLVHGNFSRLPEYLQNMGISGVDGIIADLGLSNHQLTSGMRGFSFSRDEPLDMRMDVRSDLRAEEIIRDWPAKSLKKLFREYGEERMAGKIADAVVRHREKTPIRTSLQLAEIVCDVAPRTRTAHRIHPATRVFMALRIAVNRELENLETFMDGVMDCLNPSGRLCVISFHSLEDRIVKHRFRRWAASCICPPKVPVCGCGKKAMVKILTPKALRPREAEIEANPMSRSARMRVMEKL